MNRKRSAHTAAPLPAATPTAELETHHDVAAPRVDASTFRLAWLIETRLDGLRADGLISAEGRDAARRWQRDFELATQRTQNTRLGSQGGNLPSGPTAHLAALARLRAAEQAIGRFAVFLIELCAVRDLPWARTAALVKCSDKTAKLWTAAAIAALAAHQRIANRDAAPEFRPAGGVETPGRHDRSG